MIIRVLKKSLFIFILFWLGCPFVLAEKKESDLQIPAQEIFDACRDKSINEHCIYEDENGHMVKGTCLKDTRTVLCIADPEPAKKE